VILVFIEYFSPQPTNWTPSFDSRDKIPYGLFILENTLKDVFRRQKISIVDSSFYQVTNSLKGNGYNYIYINDYFNLKDNEAKQLLKWVEKGNNVFISAARIFGINDTLKFHVDWDFLVLKNGIMSDKNKISFTSSGLNRKLYNLPYYQTKSFFSDIYSCNCKILGLSDSTETNFIKIKYGKGSIYIHTVPAAFTNYYLNDSVNYEYAYIVLSHLPNLPIIFDQHSARISNNTSPFKYFLENETLRWSLYLAVSGVFLFILFYSKRKQRFIPIIEPPKNSSLEFNRIISNLYFEKSNHKNLALKKIKFFMDFIRTQMGIQINEINDNFYDNLANKSGISKFEIIGIFNKINYIQNINSIDKFELITINKLIDEFYKKVNYVEY
jgi:hypothetical protein